jgi:hypothetical protein
MKTFMYLTILTDASNVFIAHYKMLRQKVAYDFTSATRSRSRFLSTNLIENTIRNWREASGNVKRWNEKEDMVSRWLASGLLWAEAGYRKVRGHEDLSHLVKGLITPNRWKPMSA